MASKYEKDWDKGNELHTDNPKSAIIYYLKASDGIEHPLLFAEIADCYFRMGDIENCEKYYDIAEENGLLEEKEKETESVYNDYAWFLYSQKKDYERALKVAQIAYDMASYEDYIVDTYMHILIAANKEEGMKQLTEIFKKNPKFEFSTKLFEIYKKEIQDIVANKKK